jgi:hypothetical protein
VQRVLDVHLLLYDYDAVVCEFAFMAGYRFPERAAGGQRLRLILDEHNIEYDLLRRTALTTSGARRAFHELNWRKLKQEEVAIWRRFDACALASTRDQELVRREVPELRTALVPNGVDIEGFRPQPASLEVPKTLLCSAPSTTTRTSTARLRQPYLAARCARDPAAVVSSARVRSRTYVATTSRFWASSTT